eukprot:gb/GEZJ01008053.1/.p1 GENE.gb/GEZJ01008053.1/~~gb/GEZJ01008053.1/.p1  ORF type:complete len:161 (-),score=20.13 gb/GEZJ01008053.1/:226-708(-)
MIAACQSTRGIPHLTRYDIETIDCTTFKEDERRRAPLYEKHSISEKPLEMTPIDISGPISPVSSNGSSYLLAILDEKTKQSTVFFFSNNSWNFSCIKRYKELAENELIYCCMNRIRLDTAGENSSNELVTFYEDNGILLECSPPYAHQCNGAAERLIQDL